MGPSKASSSKGKNADNSHKNSDWSWYERGGSHDNALLDSSSHSSALLPGVAANLDDNTYAARQDGQDDYPNSAGSRDYQTSSPNSDNYTVASPIQRTSSHGTAVAYSPQLTTSLSNFSTAGYGSGYGSTSSSAQYQYASQSSNHDNRSYQTSQYNHTDGLASTFNDMSLGGSSAVPEQGNPLRLCRIFLD
jgi:hypothetical protein